jgi:hypothetical protein
MASASIITKELECKDFVIHIPPDLASPCQVVGMLYLHVSKQLRNVNEKAYTPNLVSIGPFHRKVDGLKDMKMQKLRYFQDFLD